MIAQKTNAEGLATDGAHEVVQRAELTAVTLAPKGGEPRVDSRLLAKQLDNRHKNTWELIKRHKAKLLSWGKVPFQTEALPSGQRAHYALLNENQCHFLLTLSKNTPRVVDLKAKLVTAFSEARLAAELHNEYLPGNHVLHDQIHALPGNPEHERFAHMNMNKLLNTTAGIEPGGRARAGLPSKALLIVAQHRAAQAMQGAVDRSDGYARVKVALEPLAAPMIGGGHGTR